MNNIHCFSDWNEDDRFYNNLWLPVWSFKFMPINDLNRGKKHCLFYLLRIKQGLLEKFSFIDLVGGLEHFLFFHILGIIIPTDKLIFFRGVAQPPTRDEFSIPNLIDKGIPVPMVWLAAIGSAAEPPTPWSGASPRFGLRMVHLGIWTEKQSHWKINLWEPRQIRAPAEVLVG